MHASVKKELKNLALSFIYYIIIYAYDITWNHKLTAYNKHGLIVMPTIAWLGRSTAAPVTQVWVPPSAVINLWLSNSVLTNSYHIIVSQMLAIYYNSEVDTNKG